MITINTTPIPGIVLDFRPRMERDYSYLNQRSVHETRRAWYQAQRPGSSWTFVVTLGNRVVGSVGGFATAWKATAAMYQITEPLGFTVCTDGMSGDQTTWDLYEGPARSEVIGSCWVILTDPETAPEPEPTEDPEPVNSAPAKRARKVPRPEAGLGFENRMTGLGWVPFRVQPTEGARVVMVWEAQGNGSPVDGAIVGTVRAVDPSMAGMITVEWDHDELAHGIEGIDSTPATRTSTEWLDDLLVVTRSSETIRSAAPISDRSRAR